MKRGHGRGCRRRPTRGRGREARTLKDRAATPPLADEVAREDVLVVSDNIHDKEAPP